MALERSLDEQKVKKPKPENKEAAVQAPPANDTVNLQDLVGNRTMQRMIAQKSESHETSDLDDETAAQIESERDGGQPLGDSVREQMESSMGYDFSQVRVHTGSKSDDLNRQLGARAFTTGRDIFFRDDAYDPQATDGQRLIAHELAHVVQQGTGAVKGEGDRLTVNPPGDTFEQQADSVAQTVTNLPAGSQIQRQEMEEEEEMVQMQEDTEEEELVQMQVEEDEEEEEELMP
jgi:hypothetical protein